MNVPRLLTLFHLSFMVLGIVALLLMVSGVLWLDWPVSVVIVAAIAVNAFFSVLWFEDSVSERAEKPEIRAPASRVFPMVSIIASAYNQERDIARCVRSLYDSAMDYRGPTEIIIVDDGSIDETYESAWTAIGSIQKEAPHIRAHVIKHMTHLGREEAIKTGANKTTGEYLALIDTRILSNHISLNRLIDTVSSTEKTMISYEVTLPERAGKPSAPRSIQLYRADALRRLLNEEHTEKAAGELRF
jgi:cellulose synthase/poly-beta-1,6-N-acetylglucosamine synthase-like glycosyltransferase